MQAKIQKVIKLGNALIVQLPVAYVRKSGLKKGDKVGIFFDEILLIVNPKPNIKEELTDD